MMKVAIISSPSSKNTHDLKRAAESRGYTAKIYTLNRLALDLYPGKNSDFFDHDAYVFRGYNKSYSLARSLAASLVRRGKIVLDSNLSSGFIPSKLNEALVYSDNNIAHIGTRLISSVEMMKEIDEKINYPVVVKDVDSQKGQGVKLCCSADMLSREISQNGKNIIIQDYVEMSYDIRVLIVDRQVIGAIRRDTIGGDFRSNVSLGATASAHQLTTEEHSMALKAHAALGYDISGVDLAYDSEGRLFVIETNITPEWQGFKSVTGIDVAEKIIQYLSDMR